MSAPDPRTTRLGTFHPVPVDTGYRWDLACAGCGSLLVLTPNQWSGRAAVHCSNCRTVMDAAHYDGAFVQTMLRMITD